MPYFHQSVLSDLKCSDLRNNKLLIQSQYIKGKHDKYRYALKAKRKYCIV